MRNEPADSAGCGESVSGDRGMLRCESSH